MSIECCVRKKYRPFKSVVRSYFLCVATFCAEKFCQIGSCLCSVRFVLAQHFCFTKLVCLQTNLVLILVDFKCLCMGRMGLPTVCQTSWSGFTRIITIVPTLVQAKTEKVNKALYTFFSGKINLISPQSLVKLVRQNRQSKFSDNI